MPAGINAEYNNCFVLGGKSRNNGKLIKVPMFINKDGEPKKLYGGKSGEQKQYYELTYEQANRTLNTYLRGDKRTSGDESLRVSLYLDNAMFGGLHIFVIDFDKIDGKVETESDFFKAALRLADKVTRSQGGGYHMFYGVSKEAATPLFDSINLLASENAASFVCKTGAVTLDGANKVDLFCDTRHFIYEWEPWDNTIGLTDKTQELYQLIKENFALKRPMSGSKGERSNSKGGKVYDMLEELSYEELLQEMSAEQQKVFADLQTISSDCSSSLWFSTGINIYHVFGEDLGGKVFLFWSEPGHSFNLQGCSLTWSSICDRGPDTTLNNSRWAEIMGFERNAFDLAEQDAARERENALA